MLFSILLVILIFVGVMLVSGNNLSVCVGSAVGSRVISKRFGMFLGAGGFSLGLLFQGSAMMSTVDTLFPNGFAEYRAASLLVAVLIFIAAELIRVPMSLGMSLVGLLAGLSVGKNNPSTGTFMLSVATMWFVAPLISISLAFVTIRYLNRSWPKDFWQRILVYKILLIGLSFSTAYVLGANTLGLLVATGGFNLVTVAAAIVGIFVGTFFLSRGGMKRISQEFYSLRYASSLTALLASTILIEAATFFNLPLSNTQTTTSAIFGTGISYRTKFISLKPFLTIVASWVAAPILSFGIGILIKS